MKIGEYEQMMSWLTRPESPKIEQREMFNQGSSVDDAVRTVNPEQDSFKKLSNVLGAYKRYRRGEKNPKISFSKFFELYSTENFATGGRVGFENAGLVREGRVGSDFEGLFSVRGKNYSAADNIPGAIKFGPDAIYFKNKKDAEKYLNNKLKYAKGTIGKNKIPADDPERLKKIHEYVKDYKEKFGRTPSAKNIKLQFKSNINTVEAYESKYGKLDKIDNRITGVQRDVVNILNDPQIIAKLKAGKFPTITDVRRITKLDPTLAESRLVDFAEKIKENPKYKTLADDYLSQEGLTGKGEGFGGTKTKRSRVILENRFSKLMGLDQKLQSLRKNILRKIQNFIPELKGQLAVDEIAGLTSSMRRGSGPYAIFGQVLDRDFNSMVKGIGIDKTKGFLEKALVNLDPNDPDYKKKRIELQKNYNDKVIDFENKANADNPAKKVKGMKLSFQPPSKAIKNKKVYNQYKDLFDAHFEKYGYSFEVPADRDSLVDISKKLDDKAFQGTVKNRFKNLINRGGKVGVMTGLGTLVGTGFALADEEDQLPQGSPGQLNPETKKENIPYEAALPVAGALGKYAKPLLKGAFKTIGSAPAAVTFAGSEIKKGMDEGKTFADAATEPLVGIELLYPELFKKAGLGFNALNKLARVTSPVGAAVTGGGILKNVITDSEPNLLIDKETGEPKTFEREDASFVMPTMIDMNEQAYKLSKEKGISYEDAFRELAGDKTFQEGIESLKEKFTVGGRVGLRGGGMDMGASSSKSSGPAGGASSGGNYGGNNSGPDRSRVSDRQERNHQRAVAQTQMVNKINNARAKQSPFRTFLDHSLFTKGLKRVGSIPNYHQLGGFDFMSRFPNTPSSIAKGLGYGYQGLTEFGKSLTNPDYSFEEAYEKAKEEGRLNAVGIDDFFNPNSLTAQQYSSLPSTLQPNFATGGRVGFADGSDPKDPKMNRRTFMKVMGGLASLPIVGRLFDVAKVVESAAPVVKENLAGAPDHFWNLVNKIKLLGDNVTQFGALAERQSVKKYKDFELTEDMATGQIDIQRMKLVDDVDAPSYYGNPLTEETYMSYRPGKGQMDETMKGKTPPDEYEEGTAYLRTDREYAGEVVDEVSGVSDDIFQEAGVPVPEAIRKK